MTTPHPMLTKYLVVTLSLLATTALAQIGSTPPPAPLETTFEAPGLVEAKMFLPENLMKGGLHTINPQAENDGLLNTYFLDSGSRSFEVTTGIALRIRIRELYAIDKLRGTSKTDEFTKALSKAGKQLEAPALLALARFPNVTVKATGVPHYSSEAYPFPALHAFLRQVYDAFGPHRMFWGTDITKMPCSWRQCVTMFTEELPWLSDQDKRLIMGQALCAWWGWERAA